MRSRPQAVEGAPSIFRSAALQRQAQRQAASALPWAAGPGAARRLWLLLVLLVVVGSGLAWSAHADLAAARSAAGCGAGLASPTCAVAGVVSGPEARP